MQLYHSGLFINKVCSSVWHVLQILIKNSGFDAFCIPSGANVLGII